MFSFFKKKKKNIDTNQIKDFNSILEIIKDFIYFEEFEKASIAINEIIEKENESFNNYIKNIEEKKKKEEIDKFKKKIDKIYKLKKINEEKKKKNDLNIYNKRKKEEIKFINKKIIEYIWKWEFEDAALLLNNLLISYHGDLQIINFVNKQKKIINKNIELNKKKKEKEIKRDAFLQAQELIWDIKNETLKEEKKIKKSFFEKLKETLFFYSRLKKKLEEKKLLDEINLLLQIEWEENEIVAKTKLSQIHSWIAKEISWEKINGYELYWKILWADKISWDSLWYYSNKNNYTFYIWDATWHWIKAWFIISQLTKKFGEIVWKMWIEELIIEINNSLKQDLKSWNFITSIFFNINKHNPSKLNFIWMWHEPMFLYKRKTNTIEKIMPGWLAIWIRIIKNANWIKKRELEMDDWDILIAYTDWIVEAKSQDWEMYWIDRIWRKLQDFARNERLSINDIYKKFVEDLKDFTWWKANYLDDVSILLLKRDKNKEVIEKEEIIDDIIKKEWLDIKYKKNIKWKNLTEIKEEILKLQKENALKNIIKHLDTLYKTWEIPKLKQECIRFIKEWYIHKKINRYLKESLDNENLFKIRQKEQKVRDKYNILKELYKKWDYETVITECLNIINKDWNL